MTVHVVGIFQVQADDAYWDSFNFEAPKPTSFAPEPPFFALTSSSILLHALDHIASQNQVDGVFFTTSIPSYIYLSYGLDTSNIVNSNLDDLISRLGALQIDNQQQFSQGFNPDCTI